MTDTAAVLPESGSRNGVHLRGGEYRDAEALPPPTAYLGGALYSIYPRAFSAPGTLAAIEPELARIAGLGASAIWLLPVHPVGRDGRKGSRGSPYAIRDYRAVDPALGTLEDLRRLTARAHELGLRVLLDFVANHAANDPVMGAAHPDWFAADSRGRPARRVADWSDVADWRHEAEGAAAYLVESAAYWMSEAGIDGYRCDVAGMVPRWLWREVHERLAALRPDHFMLAEWQDPVLHPLAFHASYDWVFYRALKDVALGRLPARAVGAALTAWSRNFPPAALPLRFLENHDEPRSAPVFGRLRLPAYAAVVILSGGLPLLYNGQEIGAVHRPSLFEAEPIDWSRPGGETERLYRGLLALQRQTDPWGPGPATVVGTDRSQTVVAYVREGTSRRGLVVANLAPGEITVRLVDESAGGPFHRIAGGRDTGPVETGSAITLAAGEAWIGEGVR
jgi:glycosidase